MFSQLWSVYVQWDLIDESCSSEHQRNTQIIWFPVITKIIENPVVIYLIGYFKGNSAVLLLVYLSGLLLW